MTAHVAGASFAYWVALPAAIPFLLDFGLFHDELTDEQRAAMGREVSAVAAPGEVRDSVAALGTDAVVVAFDTAARLSLTDQTYYEEVI